MMPKKREREEEESTKKKFKQTTLDFHFSDRDKRKQAGEGSVEEEDPADEMSQEMSAEERAQLKRRRELMAAAAERRKQADSPFRTPPQSPPDMQSQENGSNANPTTSQVDTPSSPPSQSAKDPSEQKTSDMLCALSKACDEPEQARTSADEKVPSDSPYRRAEWYDYVLERSREETGVEDPGKHPSTSREVQLAERLADAEGRLGDSEGCEGGRTGAGQAGADSPTLEYMYAYDGDGSQPLFTDSEPLEEHSEDSTKDTSHAYWKGTPISELNRAPNCLDVLPEMRPSRDHTILFRPHVRSDTPPRPFPENYQDRWDTDHVRMPCSPENLYPVEDQTGRKKVQSRWELIESALLSGIKSSLDLEDAIMTYNARYCQRWNFRALHTLFTEVLDADESVYFFDKVLPEMVSLALQLPKLCTQAIPLLRRQRTQSITLSQQQIACLLANAFFCTFPRRNAQQKKSEFSRFPDINFNRLFEMGKGSKNHRKIEKLKCLLTYFRRITTNVPTGTVTISRRAIHDMPRWNKSSSTLTRLHMASSGTIEGEGHGMLQVDFANKYIGGGVLGFGCVQEEIRFMICPELIITRLVTEVLDDNECLVIKGAEQFSSYSGYANTFKWRGSYNDCTPCDSWGRRETEIVAIDALVIHSFENQFRPNCLQREINKAFCGFYGNQIEANHLPAVATGNWGCGAFGGDTRLKGLLQLMAASECGRDLVYFTFGDKELCDDMAGMHQFLTSQGVTVGELWPKLNRYRTDVLQRGAGVSKPKLFPYLYQLYTTCDSDSDTDEYDPEETAGEGSKPPGSISPNYQAETP